MIDSGDLKSVAFFSGCNERELASLNPYFTRMAMHRHQPIYQQGDIVENVFAVLKGDILLHSADKGTGGPRRLAVIKAGEMFGFGEFMLPRYYTSASALTGGCMLAIRAGDFRDHAMKVASVRNNVLSALCHITHFLMNKQVGGGGMTDLALYLQSLCQQDGVRKGAFIHVRKKVRQPEVASLLNLSREHVTRLFAKLRQQGVVDFNRGFPIINHRWLEQQVPDLDLAASIQYRDAPI